jgi:hypothetical protein
MVHTKEGEKGFPPFEKGGVRGILKLTALAPTCNND